MLTAMLSLSVGSGIQAQPGNYVRNYTNGRVYQQSSVLAGVRPVRTLRTYYPNGQLMREESFIFGRRNGMTRL